MLKRTNKLTALLVAATSVAAIAPTGAMAADYKRISSEDGTVYSATAFKDGSYVVDGNVVDKDTDAVYYVKDGKYTELDDIDSGSNYSLYGDHYLSVDSGDYYIDLNTGKVTDDDIADDNKDDVETSLRKQFKKVDRYGSTNNEVTVKKIAGPNYGEVWYKTTQPLDNTDSRMKETTIYSDVDGNYIDAEYNLGKIKVVTSNGSATKISNIENSEDSEDGVKTKDGKITSQVRAYTSPSAVVIGQDADYIYRVATMNVYIDNKEKATGVTIQSIDSVDVKNVKNFEDVNNDGTYYRYKVIQKISKAQASDEIDDAKYAKSVTNYIPSVDKDGKTSTSDAKNSAKFFETVENGPTSKDSKSDERVNISVANGRLIAYTTNYDEDGDITSVSIQSTALKSKGSVNYLDAEDKVDKKDATSVDTDVDGNVYRLDNGYIYKFDNTDDWDKLYRVDGSMDEFSVYDSNNMVVWNEGNEVYSVIGSNASNNDEDNNDDNTDNNTPAVTAGWNQAANGTWTYVNADGTTVKGWFQSPLSGNWFFMDTTTGVMQTGWVQSPYSGQWFYMNPSNGNMETGWVQSPASGKWYFMNLTNGNMETGWVQSPYSGKWYYMDANGAMVTNTTVNGYVLGADGAWVR